MAVALAYPLAAGRRGRLPERVERARLIEAVIACKRTVGDAGPYRRRAADPCVSPRRRVREVVPLARRTRIPHAASGVGEIQKSLVVFNNVHCSLKASLKERRPSLGINKRIDLCRAERGKLFLGLVVPDMIAEEYIDLFVK